MTTLDTSRGESAHRWPQLLPGGNLLYWVQALGEQQNSGVYGASLRKPAERVKLITTESDALYVSADGRGYLLWLRNGTLVAQDFNPTSLKLSGEPHPIAESIGGGFPLGGMDVAVSNGILLYGSFGPLLTQLTWADCAGKPLGVVGEPVEHYSTFRLSPDGRLVAENAGKPAAHRAASGWFEAEGGVSRRLTIGNSLELFPIWSPDSRTVLFARFGLHGLIGKPANGVGEERSAGLP